MPQSVTHDGARLRPRGPVESDAMYTWDQTLLYDSPKVGICAVTGARETGRDFIDEKGKRAFLGDGAQLDAVVDFVGFKTALDAVSHFKSGYAKSEWTAARLEETRPKKRAK